MWGNAGGSWLHERCGGLRKNAVAAHDEAGFRCFPQLAASDLHLLSGTFLLGIEPWPAPTTT